MLYRARKVMVNRGVASGQVPHPQAWIKRELIVSRKISVPSSPLVKDQLLFAPVKAAGRHGLVCQTVLDRLCVAVIAGFDMYVWLSSRTLCLFMLSMSICLDIGLMSLSKETGIFSLLILKSFIRLLGALRCPDGLVNR